MITIVEQGVDVCIEIGIGPMYIPPTGQPTDQTLAPLSSPEAVEVPGVGGRFAYLNACIIELRFEDLHNSSWTV